MGKREPKKLDDMPETGRVTVGHPSQEQQVIRAARENLTDYMLSANSPPGHVYVMNMDQVFAPPLESLWWMPDGDLRERWNFSL